VPAGLDLRGEGVAAVRVSEERWRRKFFCFWREKVEKVFENSKDLIENQNF
jgi:hypothetical protein